LYQIVLDRGTGPEIPAATKAEAEELLVGLQVPAFLRFVQTRHPDKVPAMFTEKVPPACQFLLFAFFLSLTYLLHTIVVVYVRWPLC
jgi:hypothetical protein